MKKSELRRYARVIVQIGAGVKKGQSVLIVSTLDQPDFTTMVVEECYKAGASSVAVRWNHMPTIRLDVKYQSKKELAKVAQWRVVRAEEEAERLPVHIDLRSVNPDSMKGANQEKSMIRSRAVSTALKNANLKRQGRQQTCIAAVPNVTWAKKVFPGMRTSAAVEKLWEAILATCRCTEDPQKDWGEFLEMMDRKRDWLNSLKLRRVHYYASNGTDLTMGLVPQARFQLTRNFTPEGNPYIVNIPAEECYTTPNKYETEGIVYGTLPWCWNGQIIEDYWLRFHEGRVVECGARKNQEFLEQLLKSDENACYLGEFALVPWNNPVNRLDTVFYDMLMDENARCHLAMGRGFSYCMEGYEDMSWEQLQQMGVNESIIHQDFMVGTADMNIDGITESGEVIPIFRNGTWAIKKEEQL